MEPCRLMIIDAHPLVLQGLAALLARFPNIQVVGEATDADDAVSQVLDLQPDVILLEPKQLQAPQLVRQLREVSPESRILIYTSYPDLWEEYALRRAGADGYLLKKLDISPLREWFEAKLPPSSAIVGTC